MLTNETVAQNGTDVLEDGSSSKHGTWTASAVGANASGTVHDGLAPDSDLLVLKALGDDGSGSTADIARAVRYAADQDASVISMSLGSPIYSEALDRAIEDASDQGAIVVVAVGNDRQRTRWVSSPADSEEAIAVAATNGDPAKDAESAYFSNLGPDPGTTDDSEGATHGAEVDVAAPGMETVARVVSESGVVENKTLSGTSMATPMVAGGIAVALEANDWTANETREHVRNATRTMPNAGTTEVGAGLHATDRLVTGTGPNTTQEDARTDGAESRDVGYTRLSDSSGGLIQQYLGTVAAPAEV